MITINEGENLIAIYRRHKLVLFFELFPLAFFAIVIAAIVSLFFYFLSANLFPFAPIILLVAVIFLHQLWLISFFYLADFYLDIWILTDKRLVSVEQKGMFSRTVIEFDLGNIQDISIDVHGVLPTLLHYGNIRIHTASENQEFSFKDVGNPNAVKNAITATITSYQKLAV